MALKSIVVATDFSEPSERALDFAISIAPGARITVVHVYDIAAFSLPPGYLVPTADVIGTVQATARSSLDDLLARKRRDGVAIDGVLRDGAPWENIETVAEETHADLVVVGTHQRHGLSRMLLGSVAERVIRSSKRPVLCVPTT